MANSNMSQGDQGNNTLQEKCPYNSFIELLTVAMDTNNRILLIAFNVLLVFCTIFLNLLSVVTIRKSSQLKNKLCYFVILVQSAVDFGVGVLSITSFIVFLAIPLLGIRNCVCIGLLFLLEVLPLSLSTVTLSAMTAERYIGVLHPYSYQTSVTKRRISIYVAVVISLCLFDCTGLIFFSPIIFGYISSLMRAICFLFMVYAYTSIFFEVKKLDRSARRPNDSGKQDQSRRRRLLREIKHAKSCFIVVICYGICSQPITLTAILARQVRIELGVYVFWFFTLLMLNSSVNSVLFFWTKTLLRTEAWNTLKSLCRRE